MNNLRWFTILTTVIAWLTLSWCQHLDKPRWYVKGNIDDVLRWKGKDALTIIEEPECSKSTFQYIDKDWQPMIVIQDYCKTKSQWI